MNRQQIDALQALASADSLRDVVVASAEVVLASLELPEARLIADDDLGADAPAVVAEAVRRDGVAVGEDRVAVAVRVGDRNVGVLTHPLPSDGPAERGLEPALVAAAGALSATCGWFDAARRHTTGTIESSALHLVMEGVAAAVTDEEVAEAALSTITRIFGWEVGAVLRPHAQDVEVEVLATTHEDLESAAQLQAVFETGPGLKQRDLPGGFAFGMVWPLHAPTRTHVVLLGQKPFGAEQGVAEIMQPLARIASVVRAGLDRVAHAEAQVEAEHARRANQAKSEFLSRMSHELRTPLNAVLGFAQLLEMDELDDDALESVDQIRKAGDHLLSLVDEVLDIARIEAGRMSLSLEPLDVDELMTEARSLVIALADRRAISLIVGDVAGKWVTADRQRTKQILLNLVSNAIKYNREGGSVRLDCETHEAMITLRVSDTGPGIPPERMSRLFIPFDRLGAESGTVEGTGLGLALSLRLAEAMGGTLEAESEVGAGTTFSLTLPAAEDPSRAADTPAAAPDAGSPAPGIAPTHATILYIEDNLPNLKLVQRIMQRRPGIDLLHALQGVIGVELAQSQLPDLVLLDLDLPDIHGREVLARLRGEPTTADIPIVVVSADATDSQIRRMRDAGADAYLTKPLDVRAFLTTIDRHLPADQAGAGSEPAEAAARASHSGAAN